MKQHPLSAAFPAMASDEYLSLVDSITNNGVINPITVYEGMVLDGWHRFNAANEVGVSCPMVELGDVDPQAFVIAQNKDRRHITQSQIALAAAAVYKWRPGAGRPQNNSAPGTELTKTTAEIAKAVGVGVRTMERAKTVESKAVPKVKEAVKTGDISVKRAAEIAQLPAEEQVKAMNAPKPGPEEDFGPDEAEIAAMESAVAADMAAMEKLFEADDKLAAAFAEIKRLNAENAQLKLARDGYMNKSNELIKTVKSLQRRLEKFEKAAA